MARSVVRRRLRVMFTITTLDDSATASPINAAANAIAEEIQFRSIVLGMLVFALPNYGTAANALQAVLYGIVHRRLWRERDWYFLAGSVIPAIVGHFAVTVSIFAFAGGRLRQRPI